MVDYAVRAFLCDDDSKILSLEYPLERDERNIRVCFQADRNTDLQDVSILTVNNFKFTKSQGDKTLRRSAVDGGVAQSGTSMTCPGGSGNDCYLSTELPETFFDSDGEVEGQGTVAMQFDNRRLLRGDRDLQDFAGMADVSIQFMVEDGFDKNLINDVRRGFKEKWNEQPKSVKALCIFGVVVLCLLCLCICLGLIFWRRCCTEISAHWARKEREGDDEVDDMRWVDGKSGDKGGFRNTAYDESSNTEYESEQRNKY